MCAGTRARTAPVASVALDVPPTPACGWTPTWQHTHLRDLRSVDFHARHAHAKPERAFVLIDERQPPRARSALECAAERAEEQAMLHMTKDTGALLRIGLSVGAEPSSPAPLPVRPAVRHAADDDAAGTPPPRFAFALANQSIACASLGRPDPPTAGRSEWLGPWAERLRKSVGRSVQKTRRRARFGAFGAGRRRTASLQRRRPALRCPRQRLPRRSGLLRPAGRLESLVRRQ